MSIMSILTSLQRPSQQPLAALLVLLAIPGIGSAEIVDQSKWLVRSGDTVYSIARQFFPDQARQQAQFRKQLITANPQVFSQGARNMKVGVKLNLPQSAIKQQQTVKKPAPVQRPATSVVATRQATRAVTQDPQQTVGMLIASTGGTLSAENRGSTRPLTRHANILKGDTLSTPDQGHAQIRMKDGALIYLRPNTSFKIEEYSFNGAEDGTEKSLFELLRGSFQTITGLIGHKNKQNYQVRTTVATMGIRGTHYGLMLCTAGSCADQGLQDGLYGGVVDGAVVAVNETGTHQFNNDQYFHIASASSVPVETLAPPPVFHGQAVEQQLVETGTTAETLQQLTAVQQPSSAFTPADMQAQAPIVLPADLSNSAQNVSTSLIAPPTIQRAPAGSAMLASFNYIDSASGLASRSTTVQVPGASGSNQIYLSDTLLPSGQTSAIPIASHAINSITQAIQDLALNQPNGSGGTMTVEGSEPLYGISWGRWSGNYAALEDGVALNHNSSLHFIYSENITPDANLQAMALPGITTYSQLAGAGSASDQLGNTALASVSMGVDFTSQQIATYTVDVSATAGTFHGEAAAIPFSALDQSFALTDAATPVCSGTCSGQASVAFVGAAAEAAMTSFSITDTTANTGVSGTAVLTRP